MLNTRSTPATAAAASTSSFSSPPGAGATMIDLRHAGDLGGNGVHQHRGRIGRLAAGDVQADPIQRCHLLAEHGAVGFGKCPGILFLALGVGANAGGGDFQRLALGGGNIGQRPLQPGGGDFQIGGPDGGCSVEALREFQQGLIASRSDLRENFAHRGGHGFVGDAFPGGQGFQAGPEIGVERYSDVGCRA